jgi:hypothetical protein
VKVIEGAVSPAVRRGPFLDRLAGVMDGLRGLPDVQTPRATARLARIERWAGMQDARMASHYGPLESEMQGLRGRLDVTRSLQARRLDEMRSTLAELRAAGPEVGPCLGESALPDRLVTTRRRREFERAVQTLRTAIATAEDDLAFTEQFAAACVTALEALQEQWNADSERVTALAGRRRAKYLAGVTWSHPDRSAVVAAFSQPAGADDYEQLHLVTTEESA